MERFELGPDKFQMMLRYLWCLFPSLDFSIFGVILKKQVQNIVNSLPSSSFNMSFSFGFQSRFSSAFWSPLPLVSGGVLLSYVSRRVKVNLDFISEDAIGLRFNHTHTLFIFKLCPKFSKSYRKGNWGIDICN